MGGVFVLAVMLVVLLIPKPTANSSIYNALAALTSPLKKTSKLAQGQDGQDEPNANKQQVDPDAEQLDKSGENGEEPGNKDGADGKGKGERDGDDNNEQERNNENSDSDQQQDQQSNNKPKNQESDSKRPDRRQPQQQDDNEQRQQNANRRDADNNRQRNDKNDQRNQQNENQARQRPQQSNQTNFQQVLDSISKFSRMLVYLVGAIAAVVLLFLFRKELAALWNLIAGKRPKKSQSKQETSKTAKLSAPPPSFGTVQKSIWIRRGTEIATSAG